MKMVGGAPPGLRTLAARAQQPGHASLCYVLVKTFDIFIYICNDLKLSNNLSPN